MAKQGPKPGEIPTQVIPLPDPPSECGSAVMSDGSLTASVMLPCDESILTDTYTDIEMQRLRHLLHEPHHHSHTRPPSVLKPQSLKYKTNHAAPVEIKLAPTSECEHSIPSSKKKITFIEPEKQKSSKEPDGSTTDRSTSDDDDTRSKGSGSTTKRRRCCGWCSPMVVYTLFGIAITATIVAVGINMLLYFDRQKGTGVTSEGTTHDFTNGTTTLPPNNNDAEYSSIESMMRDILESQFRVNLPADDPLAPANLALQWLVTEAQLTNTNSTQVYDTLEKFGQRFGLLVMHYALPRAHSLYTSEDPITVANSAEPLLSEDFDSIPRQGLDECEWEGISCNFDGMVIQVDFSDHNLTGTIPSEIKFLANLRALDLSNNALQGTLPESIYGLQDMQKLYLYHNQLGGTLSRYIHRLDKLEILHLSRNKFVGPIPQEIQSDEEGFRPLKYLNLYDNRFSGTIPRNLRLRDLWYFDIGRNRFVGSLPEDMGETFVALRYLHIDNNRLSGSIPEAIPPMANGRLYSFLADHNYLSGRVPDNWQIFDKLTQYTLHENNFESLGPLNCQFNVFAGIGNLIEFTADCDICGCNDIFCDRMCGRA